MEEMEGAWQQGVPERPLSSDDRGVFGSNIDVQRSFQNPRSKPKWRPAWPFEGPGWWPPWPSWPWHGLSRGRKKSERLYASSCCTLLRKLKPTFGKASQGLLWKWSKGRGSACWATSFLRLVGTHCD